MNPLTYLRSALISRKTIVKNTANKPKKSLKLEGQKENNKRKVIWVIKLVHC